MQIQALADIGFAIPARPTSARAIPLRFRRGAASRPWFGLPPLQEASLVGMICLGGCWAFAELALMLVGV